MYWEWDVWGDEALNTILDCIKLFLGGYENSLILMSILSFITTLLLVMVTIKYVCLTRSISDRTWESVEITKEKEKIDRTLRLIEKFDSERFLSLQDKLGLTTLYRFILPTDQILRSLVVASKDPNFRKDIAYFINYFDTVAIFYLEDKLDKKLFDSKISEKLISFIFNYREEIRKIVEGNKKDVEVVLYWQQNFLKLTLEVLYEKIQIDSEIRDFLKNCYNFYEKLLGD